MPLCKILALACTAALIATAAQAQPASTIVAAGETTAGAALQNEYAALADSSVTLSYTPMPPSAAQTAFLTQNQAALGGTAGGPVHFAMGFQDVTSDQIAAWNSTMAASAGNLIQLPAFVMPVAIPYNYPYAHTLILNDSDLCGIFSGKITNWDNLSGTVSANQKKSPLAGPITVVYRTDETQTSMILTRHLASACTPATSSITFTTTGNFASLFPSGLPANFTGAGSSLQVQALMNGAGSLTNAIGYVEVGFTGEIPSLAMANPAIKTAKLRNAVNGVAYFASPSSVIAAVKYPGANAVNAQPPTAADAADQTLWVPQDPQPAVGYPLIGYVTVLLAQCYHDPAVKAGLVSQLFGQFSVTLRTAITAAGFQQDPGLFEVPMNREILGEIPYSACKSGGCPIIGTGGVTTKYSAACATKPGL